MPGFSRKRTCLDVHKHPFAHTHKLGPAQQQLTHCTAEPPARHSTVGSGPAPEDSAKHLMEQTLCFPREQEELCKQSPPPAHLTAATLNNRAAPPKQKPRSTRAAAAAHSSGLPALHCSTQLRPLCKRRDRLPAQVGLGLSSLLWTVCFILPDSRSTAVSCGSVLVNTKGTCSCTHRNHFSNNPSVTLHLFRAKKGSSALRIITQSLTRRSQTQQIPVPSTGGIRCSGGWIKPKNKPRANPASSSRGRILERNTKPFSFSCATGSSHISCSLKSISLPRNSLLTPSRPSPRAPFWESHGKGRRQRAAGCDRLRSEGTLATFSEGYDNGEAPAKLRDAATLCSQNRTWQNSRRTPGNPLS